VTAVGTHRFQLSDDRVDSMPTPAVGEHERPSLPNQPRVAFHHREVGAHQRGQVDLVDDEKIRLDQAQASLAGDLVAARHVDDIEVAVHQLGAECQREVVAPALEQDQVRVGEAGLELSQRRQVHGGILPNGGMRAGAGLHAEDPRLIQDPPQRALDVDLVLAGDDVIRYHQHGPTPLDQPRNQAFDQGRLAGPHGAADTHPQRRCHEANRWAGPC